MKALRPSCTPGREGAAVLAMLLALVLAAILSLCLGAVGLTPKQLVSALLQGEG